MSGLVLASDDAGCIEAPFFEAVTIDNERIVSRELKGKRPLYIKFWLSSCPTCLAEMPHLVHTYEQYGDGVQFIAINLGVDGDTPEVVARTAADYGLDMPITVDESGEIQAQFGVFGTPTHIVVDRDGRIVHSGHKADEKLDAALDCVYSSRPGSD
jgi:peroxiredoxin